MHEYLKTPFNIELLILTKENSKYMKEVTSTNIFVPSSTEFDPKGLFSTEIFNAIGSTERNQTFGYIDLHIDVLHPFVFQQLISLKAFYKDIVYGTKYAIFDKKEKDFVLSNINDGHTGFTFFMSHIMDIKLDDNDSLQRKYKIDLINLYNNEKTFSNRWLVLPAGLRDYSVDEAGKPSEDEVNDIYRKLLNATALLKNIKVKKDEEHLIDNIKLKIQVTLGELYQYFRSLLDGKNKFIQGKWSKRAIVNGTRNVLTPIVANFNRLDNPNNIQPTDTVLGLHQYARCIAPITMNKLHTKFIARILNPNTTSANLVNPKTMKTELKEVSVKKRDEWLSLEGLDNVLNLLGNEELIARPVIIDEWYLLLIYDDGKNIELIFDTNTMSEGLDSKYTRPITYAELIYLSIYDIRDKYPGFVTRYPVAGLGGVYPSTIYVKTTTKGRVVKLKAHGIESEVIEYPILKENFVRGMSVNNMNLQRLGADFDGDMLSVNIVYEEESVKELKDFLNSKQGFLTPEGDLAYVPITDTIDYVMAYMTDDTGLSLSTEEHYTIEELTALDQVMVSDTIGFDVMPVYNDVNLKHYYWIDKIGKVYKIKMRRSKIQYKEIKSFLNGDGYVEYVLTTNDGKTKHLQAHRLAASSWYGRPADSNMRVNHIDGVRTNNNINNLEWITHSANIKHSYDVLNRPRVNQHTKKR